MARSMQASFKIAVKQAPRINPQVFYEAIKLRAFQYAQNYLQQNRGLNVNFKGVQAVYTVILMPEPLLRGAFGKVAQEHPRAQQALTKLQYSGILQ